MGVGDTSRYVWLGDEMRFIEAAIRSDKKVLGVCLGAQLVAHVLGAQVTRMQQREIGWYPIRLLPGAQRLAGVFSDGMQTFHWHGDAFEIPAGATPLAASAACPNQGFLYGDRVVGLQFHLELNPDLVRQLAENCGADLDGTRYVQTRKQMLSPKENFEKANSAMHILMRRLESIRPA